MKRKVLAFYSMLLAFTLALMLIQISQFGGITGNLNIDSKVNEMQYEEYSLTIFEPLTINVYAGSAKTDYLDVANRGIKNLRGCIIKGESDLGNWIIPEYEMDLKAAESGMYQFSVGVPENMKSGSYEIQFVFLCREHGQRGKISINVLNEGDSALASALTGFTSSEYVPTRSSIAVFAVIGAVIIGLVGIYIRNKHRKIESISRLYGSGRRLIKLDLRNSQKVGNI